MHKRLIYNVQINVQINKWRKGLSVDQWWVILGYMNQECWLNPKLWGPLERDLVSPSTGIEFRADVQALWGSGSWVLVVVPGYGLYWRKWMNEYVNQ